MEKESDPIENVVESKPKANSAKAGSEMKKRGRPPKDSAEDPSNEVAKSDEPIVKKSRGRPPKDPEAHALKVKKPKVPGRGRGRPPKDPSEKAAKKSQGNKYFIGVL